MCAALFDSDRLDDVRAQLRPLLRPGQLKVHWTDESATSRRKIVDAVCSLGPMNALVTHASARQRRTERFRRKCLEVLYFELTGRDDELLWVPDVVLGAVNAARAGDSRYLAALERTIVFEQRTADSLEPAPI